MQIENQKVVTCTYEMYVDGENGKEEELWERATKEHPLTYCQGEKMMLPAFEEQMAGRQQGDKFDFRIVYQDAYGEYEDEGILSLDKKIFCNGDGEFDEERVFVGNIIPMNTVDGQIVNAQVVEITDNKVTIDLNHPLAGENLHFIGEILEVRDVTPAELEAIHHPHKCGKCHGHCSEGEHKCNGHCSDNDGCDEGHHCGNDCKHDN